MSGGQLKRCTWDTLYLSISIYRIIELLMLEKISKIIKSHCSPSTAVSIPNPCSQVPHLHNFLMPRWWLQQFLEPQVLVLDSPFGEEFFSDIQSKDEYPVWRDINHNWHICGHSCVCRHSYRCSGKTGKTTACNSENKTQAAGKTRINGMGKNLKKN